MGLPLTRTRNIYVKVFILFLVIVLIMNPPSAYVPDGWFDFIPQFLLNKPPFEIILSYPILFTLLFVVTLFVMIFTSGKKR